MASGSHPDAFSQAFDESYSYASSQPAGLSSQSSDASSQTQASSLTVPASLSSAPQWLINRHNNATNSGLCRLPQDILMEIMVVVSEDRVALYLLRQVCHCFADLFGMATFERFHEREFSLILGPNKQRVELQSLPLTAFRARLIDVAFSTHTWRARHILMRDSGSQPMEITGPNTGKERLEGEEDEAEMLCDYCADDPRPANNTHDCDEFPPSQRSLSDEYMRACDMWYGNINACNHCDHHGEHFQTDRENYFEMKVYSGDRRMGGKDEFVEYLWECETCFNDLCPQGVDIMDAYPGTERPHILWRETGDSTYQQFVVKRKWVMPLFSKDEVGNSPTVITRLMVQQRLRELSEGPYEDLLRLCLGPFASFRDEAFFAPFKHDIDTAHLWGARLNLDEDPKYDCDNQTEMTWSTGKRNIYLSFESWLWTAYQQFDPANHWGQCSDKYGCGVEYGYV